MNSLKTRHGRAQRPRGDVCVRPMRSRSQPYRDLRDSPYLQPAFPSPCAEPTARRAVATPTQARGKPRRLPSASRRSTSATPLSREKTRVAQEGSDVSAATPLQQHPQQPEQQKQPTTRRKPEDVVRRVRLLLREVELPSLDVYLAETYLLHVTATAAETTDASAATQQQHAPCTPPDVVDYTTDSAEDDVNEKDDTSLMGGTQDSGAEGRTSTTGATHPDNNSILSDSATMADTARRLPLSLPQRLLNGSKTACYYLPETSTRYLRESPDASQLTAEGRHGEADTTRSAPELFDTEDDLTSGTGLLAVAQTSTRALLLPPRPQPPHALRDGDARPAPPAHAALTHQLSSRRASVDEHGVGSTVHDTLDASFFVSLSLSLAIEVEGLLTAYKTALTVALRAVQHREAVWTALQQFLHVIRTEVLPSRQGAMHAIVEGTDMVSAEECADGDSSLCAEALQRTSAPEALSDLCAPVLRDAATAAGVPHSPSSMAPAAAAVDVMTAAPPRLRSGKARESSMPGASEGRTEAGLTPRCLSSSLSAAGSDGDHAGAVDAQVTDPTHDLAKSASASIVEVPAAGDAAAAVAAARDPAVPRRPQRPSLRLALSSIRPICAAAAAVATNTTTTTPSTPSSVTASATLTASSAPGWPSSPFCALTRPPSQGTLAASTATSIRVPPLLLPTAGHAATSAAAALASNTRNLAQTTRHRSSGGAKVNTAGATRAGGRLTSAVDRQPATARALSATARRGPTTALLTTATSLSGTPIVSAEAARRAQALRELYPAFCTPLPLPAPHAAAGTRQPRSHSAPGTTRAPPAAASAPAAATAAPPQPLSPRPPSCPSSVVTPRSRMLTRGETQAHEQTPTCDPAAVRSGSVPPLRQRLRSVSRDVYVECLLHYFFFLQRTTLAVVEAVGELRRRHLCHPAPLVVEHRNYLLEVLLQTGTLVKDEAVCWLLHGTGSDGYSSLEVSHVSGSSSRNASGVKGGADMTPDARRAAEAHVRTDFTLSLTHEGEQADERAAQRVTQAAAVRGQWPEQLLRTPLLSGHATLRGNAAVPPFLPQMAHWCGDSAAGSAWTAAHGSLMDTVEGREEAWSCPLPLSSSDVAAAGAVGSSSRAAPPPPPPRPSLLLLPSDVLTTYGAAAAINGEAQQRHPLRRSPPSNAHSAAAAASAPPRASPSVTAAATLRRRLEAAERVLHGEVAAQLDFLRMCMRCALDWEYPLRLRGMEEVHRRFFAQKFATAHRRLDRAKGSLSGGVRYDRVLLNDALMRGDWMEELQVSWQLLMSGSSSVE